MADAAPAPDCGARASKSQGLKQESALEWEQKTMETLNHAKALTRLALQSVSQVSALPSQRSARRLSMVVASTTMVNSTIKKKITITEDLIKALEDRIESIEDTIRQAGDCLFQLQRAHRSKWAPLTVCERRLQLRDGRPSQELVRDCCQESLEHERQTLLEVRQELSDQIDSMKEMLLSLDRVKGELLEDLQLKRQALRVDRCCLTPKVPLTSRRPQDRVVLPKLADLDAGSCTSSPKGADSAGLVAEEERLADTRSLIGRAVRCEEDAMRLCNESDAVMIHTKRECCRSGAQVNRELGRRVEETQFLRKQLEAQIRETNEAILQVEMSISKTKKKLDLHSTPLRSLNKQLSLRTNRTVREDIHDAVADEMEGHLETLKVSSKVLTTKCQAMADLLEQLKSTRHQLHEDYKFKLQAQKIDDACLRVTPRKALELDRTDPRGGRCREPSRRRPGTARVEATLTCSMDGPPA